MAGPITPVEGSAFVPEIWLSHALGRLRPYLTMQRVVTMDSDIQAGAFEVGNTLHIPKRGAIVANEKTDTGDYTFQNPQSTTIDVTLTYQPEVSFQFTSKMLAVQNQDQAIGYMEDAAIALAEKIDTYLFNQFRNIAAANRIGNGSGITEANILSAKKILEDNRINPSAPLYGVISTGQEATVLQLTNLVRYDALGIAGGVADARVGNGRVVMPGAIGRAYRFEICPSQLVPQVTANDNSVMTLVKSGTVTGGTFTLTANSLTTVPLAFNSTAAQVQAALEAILGKGLVYATGGPAPSTAIIINQVGTTVYAITVTDSSTGGGAMTMAQTSQTTGSKSLFFASDFLVMATRALPIPQAGTGALGTYMEDPDTGIILRLVKSWNATKGWEQLTLDCLLGISPLRPEHAVMIETAA